ncbi:acyltransferase [Aquabacterium sp. A7-Y]|uniref:acyltransferase family protein n=1 Tax=Aquabacterium sp. A7-Y TaxID=1349605 RepID=UPI00223CE74B|nr:acyltransferase [Aquabacterium sp. A7-Y]MCW7537521.1 acyltransferase [Aquabacterium sp. A7-Y]
MQRHRFHEIDMLRGIACAMVVAFHYLWRGQQAGWLGDSPPAWLSRMAEFGYLGVHLFFMVSGFVIFMSAEGATPRQFVASRVSRLYPAFWVAAPLTAAAAWGFGSTDFAVSGRQLLLNLPMTPHWFGVEFVDGAYWSLAVELHFYILVWASLRLGLLPRTEWLLAGWLLLSSLNAAWPTYTVEFWLELRWAPFFAAGVCCYLIREHGLSRARLALLGWSFLLSLYYSSLVHWFAGHTGAGVLIAAAVVSVFYALFLLIAFDLWRLPASRWVFWAGALTYPVYLLHQNIGYLLIEAPGWRQLPFGLRVTAVCGAVTATAWVLYRCVERPLAPRLRRALAGTVPLRLATR